MFAQVSLPLAQLAELSHGGSSEGNVPRLVSTQCVSCISLQASVVMGPGWSWRDVTGQHCSSLEVSSLGPTEEQGHLFPWWGPRGERSRKEGGLLKSKLRTDTVCISATVPLAMTRHAAKDKVKGRRMTFHPR